MKINRALSFIGLACLLLPFASHGQAPSLEWVKRLGTASTSSSGFSGTVDYAMGIPPAPTITSFIPASGAIGTTVTITGTNFSATPTDNIVFFGATQATVSAASSTQLTVTVPAGATYESVSVLVNGLTAYSSKPFIVTFPDGGTINTCTFAAKADVTTGTAPYSIALGDLDGDGKPDLAVANETSNTISVFRNISSQGSLTTGSFAPKVDFATNNEPYYVGIRDLDGDGKPEIFATNNDSDNISIYKNISTTGVINASSFAAKVDFTTGENPWNATIDDFDRDGKPDLAIVNDVGNTVSILRNTSSKGIINATSFASHVEFATGSFPIGIDSEDLDGDGKIDIVVTNQAGTSISVLRNTSTVGSITAGSFAAKVDFATGLDPYSVTIGDLDGNGKPEVIVANYSSGTASVYNNTSTSGTIALSAKVDFDSGIASLMVALNDIDGDGKIDLTVTNGGNRISVLKNLNSSAPIIATSFSPRVDFLATNNPYGIAIGDLDGNGKPDVAAVNFSGTTASLLRNTVSSLPPFTASSFSPASGSIGTVVTLTGTNFSTTPINNTVKFNGIVATVTASTSTSITAIVPTGATTGSISLEIGCSTAITVLPFTVTSGSTITITKQPTSAIACVGDVATFTTEATGTTNILYQWQKFDGAVFNTITNTGGYSGTATSTLTVNTTGNFGAGDYRCKISGDLAADQFSNTVTLTVNNVPTAPTTTGASNCITAAITLNASGGSNGQYRWYDVATGGTAISGQVNSAYVTPVIATTTTYYASINNGSCESTRTPAIATIAPLAKPSLTTSVQPVSGIINICVGDVLTITAPSGFATYTWSNGASSNPITISTSTAALTLQVSDGAGCNSPLSDALNIVVNPYPVATITPNGNQLTASPGDSYQWFQNDDLITGATNQTFDYSVLEYGVYVVDVTDNGCTSTSDEFVYFITGTEPLSPGWKIYPNPFTTQLFLESPSVDETKIEITDALGRRVKTFSTNGSENISLDELSDGAYFLTLHTSRQILHFRITKKR